MKKHLTDLQRKEPSRVLYALVLILYFVISLQASRTARIPGGSIMLFGHELPSIAVTGVFSSLSYVFIIFLVVFFKKPGFITAIALVALNYPMMLQALLTQRTFASLPGLFTNTFTLITIILIYSRNRKIERYQEAEVDHLKAEQRVSVRLFEQTATALVNAIDAKDTYSHGHSLRVAEYSERIARELGRDEDECRRIYYAALLHDVGKIGISDDIINKKGKLTPEEYEVIKQHPVMGNAILTSISEYPYLSIGAHYHHERYDGKGYPDGLKGDDIPEIARIISVADAYDAMSSNRSYRDAIPQQLVREEIVKGAGTQFDPEFAGIMQILIDQDKEYRMKEKDTVSELAGRNELDCHEYRRDISDGIRITEKITRIHLEVDPAGKEQAGHGGASFILFDSLDGRYYDEERLIKDLCYYEYCELKPDGTYINRGARMIKTETADDPEAAVRHASGTHEIYDIEAVRVEDHILINIDNGMQTVNVTIALPDSSRYSYFGITGEYCHISEVSVHKDKEAVNNDHIQRIVRPISYIELPEGDVPNVQINSTRSAATEGILIGDRRQSITFHTMSLPTARLVWHCPYIVIFSSQNGRVGGPGYKEYALVRYDGENSGSNEYASNTLVVNRRDSFEGWDAWKDINRIGYDSVIFIEKNGRVITLKTENLGISIENTTGILDGSERDKVYIAITGDQCALTDIRVK